MGVAVKQMAEYTLNNQEYIEMDALFDRLFPICRSITGPGLRETLSILSEYIPLEIFGIPSGTQVFDWKIPPEWRIREAWLAGPDGRKIVDFSNHNLHVVNYSAPVDRNMTLEELKPHLYSIPHLPDAIPYVTSYYRERWGFCLPHSVLEALEPGEYHAYIDSEFIEGELNFAHAVLPGKSKREVLISTYVCHPSMANNELSGPLVATFLYRRLAAWSSREFTYRFVFVPETIGSIAYLSKFGDILKERTYAGLVLTCLGGPRQLSYKMSRRGDSPMDRVVMALLRSGEITGETRPFTPVNGSDERQYCSPGFNLPVGQVARSVYGTYDGYHNSLDNKSFMTIEALMRSLDETEKILRALELDGYYRNLYPHGEIKLDKHGLYPDMNAPGTSSLSNNDLRDGRMRLNRILYVLNYSDGTYSLADIAEKCGCGLLEMEDIIRVLKEKGILEGPFREQGGAKL
jgi:aminopeptidase-like protein